MVKETVTDTHVLNPTFSQVIVLTDTMTFSFEFYTYIFYTSGNSALTFVPFQALRWT